MSRLGLPRLDRSRFALVAALGIDNYGSGLFLPLTLVYATRVVDLGIDTAGTIVAVAGVLGFAVPAVAGRLTHRFGPRPAVVTSQLLQAAGAAGYLVSGGAADLFVAAGLMSVGTQLFYSSVFVLVADVSTNTAKERPFALITMVRAGAFGLGTLSAAIALSWKTDAALRWLVGVNVLTFVVAAFLLAIFVRTPPVDHETRFAAGPLTVLRNRSYLALMGSVCLVDLADFSLVGIPIFLIEVVEGPAWLPGALLAVSTAITTLFGVRVVDALRGRRRSRSLQTGAAVYAAWALVTMAMLWIPAGWLVPYAFLTILLQRAASMMFFPIAGALSEAMPPSGQRMGYMATYQYAFTTAHVLAPAVVALFAVAGWLPWAVVTVAALTAVAITGWLGRSIPVASNLPGRVPAAAEN